MHDMNVLPQAEVILEKAKSINYDYGIARILLNMSLRNFVVKNEKEEALKCINEAYTIFLKLDDKRWIANTYIIYALIHNTLANHELAIYNGLRGISYFEENKIEDFDKILANYVLGTIYKDLKKFDLAEKYYNIGISNIATDNLWTGRIYLGLANIYTHQEKYDLAIQLNNKGLIFLRSTKNTFGESRSLTDLGIIYRKQKKYDLALNYLFEGLKIREEQKLNQFIIISFIEIAITYFELKNYTESIIYYKKAEQIAIELSIDTKLIAIYQDLANVYKSTSDYSSAVDSFEKLCKITSEVHKKQLEEKLSNLNSELLKEKEAEIERLRNVELKQAYEIIEEKNKDILESIRYASRIQKTLLPSEKFIEKNISRLKK